MFNGLQTVWATSPLNPETLKALKPLNSKLPPDETQEGRAKKKKESKSKEEIADAWQMVP